MPNPSVNRTPTSYAGGFPPLRSGADYFKRQPSAVMRHMKTLALMLSLLVVSGCSVLQGSKLLAPESFGLVSIAPGVYIETGTDNTSRDKLLDAVEKAENAVRVAYGSVTSRPFIHACVSEECYESFGGRGSRAKVYYDRVLLSPRGLNWHFLAHEWSHAEMLSRLSFLAWLRLPQWFDEGVAVAVSEAPEHSEEHWQFLVSSSVPRPTSQELHTFRTLGQWNNAVSHYGEKSNQERKAKGLPEIRPVYTAAGHELRPWLAKVGSTGLLQFIAQMNNGADFESTYQTANTAVERHAPQATLAPRPSP